VWNLCTEENSFPVFSRNNQFRTFMRLILTPLFCQLTVKEIAWIFMRDNAQARAGSSVSIVTWLLTGLQGFDPRRGRRIFLLPSTSRRLWVQGTFPGRKCCRGLLLTTHPLPVPRIRKRGSIPPLPKRAVCVWHGINKKCSSTYWNSFIAALQCLRRTKLKMRILAPVITWFKYLQLLDFSLWVTLKEAYMN
jgi:hypothetical protein